MRSHLHRLFRKATDLATASLLDVSKALGRVRRTLQMYRSGDRRVTPEAARDLATYLRGRAQAFEEAAEELETAVRKEEEDV